MSTIKLTITELKTWIKAGKPFKIRVNSETSRIVQEAVFECGGAWVTLDKEISKSFIRDEIVFDFYGDGLGFATPTLAYNFFNARKDTPEIELTTKPALTAMGCLPVIKPRSTSSAVNRDQALVRINRDKWADLKRQYAEDEKALAGTKLNAWELYEFRSTSESWSICKQFSLWGHGEYRRRKHADLMIAWANGAKIEARDECQNNNWHNAIPVWNDSCEYRIKPATVSINGIEAPKGLTEAPALGTKYYIPEIGQRYTCVNSFTWTHDTFDLMMLERGIVHLTKENAIAMAKAMLKLGE